MLPKMEVTTLPIPIDYTTQLWYSIRHSEENSNGKESTKQIVSQGHQPKGRPAMFATEDQAERWFIDVLFDGQLHCLRCASDNVATVKNRNPMPFRCRSCRKHFSVKHGTFMQNSNI